MRVLFDTSVLIPVFLEELPHHEHSYAAWTQSSDSVLAAHSLAEFYANTTGMPAGLRALPSDVLLFISDLRQRAELVALTADEYMRAITEFAGSGHTGAKIYDFLIARCALMARVDTICSWNLRDFARFGPEVTAKLKTPTDLTRQ